MKLREVLRKGEVRIEDFKVLYPNQSKTSLLRTANYYMRPLVALGIARREGEVWKLREDVLRTVERFEELREKYGIGGDLYELVSILFTRTAQVLKEKGELELLGEELGVSSEVLREFLRELLSALEWRTPEDLLLFAKEVKLGRCVRVDGRVLTRLRVENEGRKETTEELLNSLLKKLPLSIELWERIEREGGGEVRNWIEDCLFEKSFPDSVVSIPVSKKLWEKLQEEVGELLEDQRRALQEKLALRIQEALEKTIREAKEKKRRIRR